MIYVLYPPLSRYTDIMYFLFGSKGISVTAAHSGTARNPFANSASASSVGEESSPHRAMTRAISSALPLCRTTFISLQVSVPVLSVHITCALPSVSTAGSLFTTARRCAIVFTPAESTTVTIAGSPSGIAATERLTEVMNISPTSIPLMSEKTNISAHIARAPLPSTVPSFASRFCSGVCSFSVPIISAISPTAVCTPVFTAIAAALPVSTAQEENTLFSHSDIGAPGNAFA